MEFKTTRISGAPPEMRYCALLHVDEEMFAQGQAHSKKEAERLAAKDACEQVGIQEALAHYDRHAE